jgi:hypothetical protein
MDEQNNLETSGTTKSDWEMYLLGAVTGGVVVCIWFAGYFGYCVTSCV